MPKLLLCLGVSSFGRSHVYPVALLGTPHCQEDCMSLLTQRTTCFFRKGLKSISTTALQETQICQDYAV